MNQLLTEVVTEEKQAQPLLTYWAFGDIYSGQFFICKSRKKRFKQLVLLFKLGCVASDKPLYIPEKIPAVGGVYNDTDKRRIECQSVEWV